MRVWTLIGLASVLGALIGCSAAGTVDPDVERWVPNVSYEKVEAHVKAICAIGARPAGDEEASRRTVEYIKKQLTAAGLTPKEETFMVSAGFRVVEVNEANGEKKPTNSDPVFLSPEMADVYLKNLRESGTERIYRKDREVFTSPREVVNVVAEVKGYGEGAVEFAAHYDSAPMSPGADDNASGVAALLETARVVQKVDLDKTIRFVFFAAEKDGQLGSQHHLTRMYEYHGKTEGTMILEMLGYFDNARGSQESPAKIPLIFWLPKYANFIAVMGNYDSGGLGNYFETAAATYCPDLKVYSANRAAQWMPDAVPSDHKAYWHEGLGAVVITDTGALRNPNIDTPGDTPDTLDYDFLGRVTEATVATVLHWGGVR